MIRTSSTAGTTAAASGVSVSTIAASVAATVSALAVANVSASGPQERRVEGNVRDFSFFSKNVFTRSMTDGPRTFSTLGAATSSTAAGTSSENEQERNNQHHSQREESVLSDQKMNFTYLAQRLRQEQQQVPPR